MIALSTVTVLPHAAYRLRLMGSRQLTGSLPNTISSGSVSCCLRNTSRLPVVKATNTLSQCCRIATTSPDNARLCVCSGCSTSLTLYTSSLRQQYGFIITQNNLPVDQDKTKLKIYQITTKLIYTARQE